MARNLEIPLHFHPIPFMAKTGETQATFYSHGGDNEEKLRTKMSQTVSR